LSENICIVLMLSNLFAYKTLSISSSRSANSWSFMRHHILYSLIF
jgi:hypothetical protein